MPRITQAAVMTGPPRAFDNKDFETGASLPGQKFQHVVLIEGQPYKLYAEDDLTLGLNGQREQLLSSDPVKVTATLELYSGHGNSPRVKLVSIEPRK